VKLLLVSKKYSESESEEEEKNEENLVNDEEINAAYFHSAGALSCCSGGGEITGIVSIFWRIDLRYINDHSFHQSITFVSLKPYLLALHTLRPVLPAACPLPLCGLAVGQLSALYILHYICGGTLYAL
jgi:hypothetical protein